MELMSNRKIFNKIINEMCRESVNVLPLAAVGDFEKLNCQPSMNVDRNTALQLTTSAPHYGKRLLAAGVLYFAFIKVFF
jgi:hypothetical protein